MSRIVVDPAVLAASIAARDARLDTLAYLIEAASRLVGIEAAPSNR